MSPQFVTSLSGKRLASKPKAFTLKRQEEEKLCKTLNFLKNMQQKILFGKTSLINKIHLDLNVLFQYSHQCEIQMTL